jgi:hypothetical protein
MSSVRAHFGWILTALVVAASPAAVFAQSAATKPAAPPSKVYVPYEKLKGVFESEKQGVFLPYDEFQRLWRAAQGMPAALDAAPQAYLMSAARFSGKVDSELAAMHLDLTVDILADGWVEVPIGLGDVAVVKVETAGDRTAEGKDANSAAPLLRFTDGRYVLLTRGKGRRLIGIDFVRQLVTQPGLNILEFRIPSSAITTLDLTIPEENLKVDVEPMLAASTDQVDAGGKKATKLQAFLGSAERVKLSWKPKTQAAEELAAVVVAEQLQHIHVSEALISHDVTFSYDISRRGLGAFTIQLPAGFRITAVDGANISEWNVESAGDGKGQTLKVKLFSPAKGKYALSVKMERFLKESQVKLALSPIVTQEVLRGTGLIGVTHSPRRSVELADAKDLARVDVDRLAEDIRKAGGATAWRFNTPDYGGTLVIDTVSPRISAAHFWTLGVLDDRLELRGRLNYTIERTGVFRLTLALPEPWEVTSVGPGDLVDDHQVSGTGGDRTLRVLLKREVTGSVQLTLAARAPRVDAAAKVDFALPLADAENLRLYSGQVVLSLADRLRAEVEGLRQLTPLPLNSATATGVAGASPTMAFEFRAMDRAKPAGAAFSIAVKPAQVSAVVHRLVNIQPGSIQEEALVDYRILYAPVDTFYVRLPASLEEAGAQINGPDIKEKPRVKGQDVPSADVAGGGVVPAAPVPGGPASAPGAGESDGWVYRKIVLQSPVIGQYRLSVTVRRKWQAAGDGQASRIVVEPILAAGKLSDQSGRIAVAKAETLAIGEPKTANLQAADPTSAEDVPVDSHRASAALAFRYSAPPFELSLPVSVQKEAMVYTTIAKAAVVEQVLARDGTLNTHAVFLLSTRRGDRLLVSLPKGAGEGLFAVLLNGAEAPVEAGPTADQKVVLLPPAAGGVAKIVLELSYKLKDASARRLEAPALPDDVPVQQTLWRLRVPAEDRVLWFDRAFSRLGGYSGEGMMEQWASDAPAKVAFTLPPQGRAWDFVRQGGPGTLRVLLVGREVFSILVWIVIVGLGAWALRLGGFGRCVVVLAAILAVLVVRLLAPLLARELMLAGVWAAALVLAMWCAHWVFRKLPHIRRRKAEASAPPAIPAAAPAKPADGVKE